MSVTTLTQGQELRIKVWPEPGEKAVTVVSVRTRPLCLAVAFRGDLLDRLIRRVRGSS